MRGGEVHGGACGARRSWGRQQVRLSVRHMLLLFSVPCSARTIISMGLPAASCPADVVYEWTYDQGGVVKTSSHPTFPDCVQNAVS